MVPTTEKSKDTVIVEEYLDKYCKILATAQRTSEWSTLRQFHQSATTAGKLFTFHELTKVELLDKLMSSWFSRSRSTAPMVIGSKNEGALLKAFKRDPLVYEVFECGLIENKRLPWLAASPDAITVLQINADEAEIATVEVKTRASLDRIAEAERIAQKHNMKTIKCVVGDDVWKECVDADHATQILIQLCTLQVAVAVYVVAQPGTKNGYGRIIYTVFAECPNEVVREFCDTYFPAVSQLLHPFYHLSTLDNVIGTLPKRGKEANS
jgi:hypothetical protein